MKNKIIYFYHNQPQLKHNGIYYSKYINFVDLIAEIKKIDHNIKIVIPCKKVNNIDIYKYKQINISGDTIEINFYDSHIGAIKSSILSLLPLWRRIAADAKDQSKVMICGPGPNTLLFLLSFLLPKKTIFVYFVRGNRIETVRHYYKNRTLYPITLLFTKLLQYHMINMVKQGRAYAFLYGSALKKIFPSDLKERIFSIYPLIPEHILRTSFRPDITPDRPLRLLYVGRLSDEKNVWGLIKACHQYLSNIGVIKLTVVGDGPLSADLNAYVQSVKMTDYISFTGHIVEESQLLSLYDDHDVLCLPSFTEGTPVVVMEAGARQLPVLATRVGSLPELFPNDIKYIDGPEVSRIIDGIVWCDQNRSLLSAMGRNLFSKIDKFLIEKNASAVYKIMENFK